MCSTSKSRRGAQRRSLSVSKALFRCRAACKLMHERAVVEFGNERYHKHGLVRRERSGGFGSCRNKSGSEECGPIEMLQGILSRRHGFSDVVRRTCLLLRPISVEYCAIRHII